jgi:hypothetical protein
MTWTEQLVAGLRWLKDNPEVTWSGAGFTLLGILFLVVKNPLIVLISADDIYRGPEICRSFRTESGSSPLPPLLFPNNPLSHND